MPHSEGKARIFRNSLVRLRMWTMRLMFLFFASQGWAAGPRWVTGPPYFTAPPGVPVVWYTMLPMYFTDPGDLSKYVNHAAADQIVAAAAGVWNVPTAEIVIAQGGVLAEHVSGANSYLTANGPVFPADVQSGNYAAIQIAVIYDSDGSVTEMLLGGGASNPAECLQNAVTESVDSIVPSGKIQHAILVLNGRCTGPAPQQQLQMQYQLERAFGRVLGVGWSQNNDNVFTANPQPSIDQAMHWPVMHPIDVVCGQYTYQCMPQPFTLRDDDISGITQLYLMGYSNWSGWEGGAAPPGKTYSYTDAAHAYGSVSFPTGQQMEGVNVVIQRLLMFWNTPEDFYETSSVTGFLYQQNGGNPVTAASGGMAASMGWANGASEGYYDLTWIPMINDQQGWVDVLVSTEPVNPLYIGTHAVGPYVSGPVSPSGSTTTTEFTGICPNLQGWCGTWMPLSVNGAASSCATGSDGAETAPVALAPSGWWTGLLCSEGHTAWTSYTMKAGRTATVEVTAFDENGYATVEKAMPLVGIWNANDATGTLPTVAATPSAFNTTTLGMTSVGVESGTAQSLRFVVADARGDGRPDFGYQGRVLYADTVTPSATSLTGGQITISGMGFRAGNEVLVNGVQAQVSSWTSNTIVAVAPPARALGTNPAGAVDIEVKDLQTGGTTVMSAALTYGGVAADEMTLVSAPAGTVQVGTAAATAFAVRVTLADGVTPVAGLPVTFSASGAAVQMAGCAASPCTLLTDATGLATTMVTPTAAGAVTLQAAAVAAVETASFNAVAESVAAVRAVEYVAAGATVAWTPEVNLVFNGAPAAGAAVSWTGSAGLAAAGSSSTASPAGVAQMAATIGPLAAGVTASGQACAWTPTVCAAFSAVGVDPSAWRLAAISGAGQSIAVRGTFAPVAVMVSDGAGHPVAGAPVAIHQTVDAAEMACPPRGACPIAPVLGGSDVAAVSDVNGMVSVTPMQIAGVNEVTNIAVAAGTQGFVSLAVQQGP